MENKRKRRVELMTIMEISGTMISSEKFVNAVKKRPEDFTRSRKMPFTQLMLFMLNMVKSSIQTCLDNFFEKQKTDIHMTQQSFSEAREKIKYKAFRALLEVTVEAIYDNYYDTWHGYRVSAIDGSKTQIPDDQKLKEYFGTMGANSTAATAQASALYDVLNNVIIDAQLEPLKCGERELALKHIDVLCNLPSFNKECILFDRGYASFELVETLKNRGISFVMRVKSKFNNLIDSLNNGDHHIFLQKAGHENIRVRVLKFILPSGETETLITDIDDRRMGIKAFKTLYFKRWPIETKYGEIKNKLEVENFSGRTINSIKQDFFISMYMSNVVAVACWEVQPDVDEERELRGNKYNYHVNVNHAIGCLKDRFILALLEPNPHLRSKKTKHILFLLTKHVVPTRPNRSVKRNPSTRKTKFRFNSKSNC